jgi:hypothetical protein
VLVGIGMGDVHEGVEIDVRPGSKSLGHAAGQLGQRFFLGLGAGPIEPFQPGRAQVDGKAQWPFHNHLPVAEGLVGEDLGFFGLAGMLPDNDIVTPVWDNRNVIP